MSDVSIHVTSTALTEMVSQVAESLLSCSVQSATQVSGRDAIDRSSSCVYAIEMNHLGHHFNTIVACHPSDANRLASQMTGKAGTSLTPALIQDALSEWLNIIAGQIKSLAGIDHTMGLPRMVDFKGGSPVIGLDEADGLRIELSDIEVVLWLGLVGGPGVTIRPGG